MDFVSLKQLLDGNNLAPSSVHLHCLLSRLEQTKTLVKSEETRIVLLRKVMQLNPNFVKARQGLSRYALAQTKSARKCIRSIISIHSLAECVGRAEVIIKFKAVVNLPVWLKQMSMYHMLKWLQECRRQQTCQRQPKRTADIWTDHDFSI